MTLNPQDFLDDFFVEADEHRLLIRRGLSDLESEIGKSPNRGRIDDLFRSFHTLKGLSAMVGFKEAEALSHELENHLRNLRDGKAPLTKELLNALTRGARVLERVLKDRRDGKAPAEVDSPLRELASARPAAAVPQERRSAAADASVALSADEEKTLHAALDRGEHVWRCEFKPSAELAAGGKNVNTVRERLKALGTIVRAAPKMGGAGDISFQFLVVTTADDAAFRALEGDGLAVTPYQVEIQGEGSSATPVLVASNVIRVDIAKLDDVMRTLGELVVTRSRLAALAESIDAALPPQTARLFKEISTSFERQVRSLRESVTRARMVGVGEMFARLEFAAKDLASDAKKSVAVVMRGQETEIDKFVVDHMMDPLLHLVRNAVSHGLEAPAERVAAGKPEQGTLTLSALSSGNEVIVTVEDDGRGIDPERVMRRARESGFSIAGTPGPDQVLAVICQPGFSTKDEADRAAGRGVGMEAVKSGIEALGGRLSLENNPGHGCRFVMHLPLTLSILQALITEVAGQTFAIPLSAAEELVEVPPEAIVEMENNEVLTYRNDAVSLLRLSRFIGAADSNRRGTAVIVNTALGRTALFVDRMTGQREVVVHGLADGLLRTPGIAGATQLGDGKVVLIIDAVAAASLLQSRLGAHSERLN